MLEAARLFFEQDEWPFVQVAGQSILRLAFRGQHAEWQCYARVREEHGQFLFYSVYPQRAPAEVRPAAAEFITRANYGLMLGSFEMDFDDGEVRCRTGLSVEDLPLTSELIRPVVYGNVLVMDRYWPGLRQVFDGLPAVEAIAGIES